MTTSQPLGPPVAPAPRYRSVPPAHSSAGEEAADLAASAGLLLDPWQRQILIDSLGERRDGNWAAFEVAIVAPRQNGKNAIIEARELAELFLFSDADGLIIHTAHEFRAAAEAFRRILQLIQQAPELDRLVARVRGSHGEEGIELKSGARLRFHARSTGSGRGFSGSLIVLDEAYRLQADAVAALLPTLAARPNPQIWYTSSAPLAGELSAVLRDVCRRGRAGTAESLCYHEFSADPNCDLDDRQAWRDANPALGVRITEQFVALERNALTDEAFARERLGLFADDLDAEEVERVLPIARWDECLSPNSSPSGTLAYAYEVSTDRRWASIAVSDGRRIAVESGMGTSWVPHRLAELVARDQPAAVAVNGSGPGASLAVPIEKLGITLQAVNGREYAQHCATFVDAVLAGEVEHCGQGELDRAVQEAISRPYGDAWCWSQQKSPIDIAPLVAATLALSAARADMSSVYETRELQVL